MNNNKYIPYTIHANGESKIKRDNLIKISIDTEYEVKADNYNGIITINKEDIQIISNVSNSIVNGYIEVGKKAKKLKIATLDRITGFIENSDIPIIRERENNYKTIGYLKQANSDNSYIGVTVKKSIFLYIILLILLLACIVGIVYTSTLNKQVDKPNNTGPINGITDEITQGSLGGVTTDEPLQPHYFNVNINSTPTITSDGKMNIRIQNTDRNDLNCQVEVALNIDGNNKVIYTSPLLKPTESLEFATIDEELIPGNYVGKATYYIYDNMNNKVGATAIQLDVVIE